MVLAFATGAFTLIVFTALSLLPLSSSLFPSSRSVTLAEDSLTYIWPLPSEFTFGNGALSVDPDLSLSYSGDSVPTSPILVGAFDRYKRLIFGHARTNLSHGSASAGASKLGQPAYDLSFVQVTVHSSSEEFQLGVDESYTLRVDKRSGLSIGGVATIEAPTVYGALRGLETFSQLCTFDPDSKTVKIFKTPWYVQDSPRFAFRGLLLDTSRHYLPVGVIKHILDSMSYAKLNVLHWHIIDEESFPLEIPAFPSLWKGAYSKWERYTVEDAYEIVDFAKARGIHVMAEIDVPGHGESWGVGYPDLWPSSSCREPLDVAKNLTFDVVSGILTELRKIFPFELFHLGGDEVNTDCWKRTPHVKKWLDENNMTPRDAYKYFVLRAQQIAISLNWNPVNWEETFNNFPSDLHPRTVVHNWLGPGVCPKAVEKGFRCIFSNQGVWYLDHLDVPWEDVYTAEPLEGIKDPSKQKLVLGGEVCMWGETADTSDIQQTIWPRAAAAAERLWSQKEALSAGIANASVLPRLHYFRCLLNMRGVAAAPVTNRYARTSPRGPGSCYEQ